MSGSVRAWLIVALLFSFMVINFADKAVLGLAAVPIMHEFRLSHTQFGLIGTSFFALFSLSAVLIGALANHFPTKWILLLMALSWAVVQMPMNLPLGMAALVANRVLLGLGEGPAFPVAVHATYKWFPNDRRSVPVSFLNLGAAVGAGVCAPAIVYVILCFSWHAAFAVLGVVGLAWCILWLFIGKEGPISETTNVVASRADPRIAYSRIFLSRTFSGQAIAEFSTYWLGILGVVWLPAYLIRGASFSPTEAGWIVTAPALSQIILVPGVCVFAEWLRRRGTSNRLACGWVSGACMVVAGLATAALPIVHGTVLTVLCTIFTFFSGGVAFSLCPVTVAEITPMAQRGLALATGNATATLAGVLAPAVMGMIMDSGANAVDGFRTGFVVTGLAVACVAVLPTYMIDPEADATRLGSVTPPRTLFNENVLAGEANAE